MERQKTEQVALLQVAPVVAESSTILLECWLLKGDGTRLNLRFPCETVTVRFALFGDAGEAEERLAAALGPEHAPLPDETKRDIPVPSMGLASAVPKRGTLLRVRLPLKTGALQRLGRAVSTGPSFSLCLADPSAPSQRDAELHWLRQELLFRLYDRFDLPLYVDADVLTAWQARATCVSDVVEAIERALLPPLDEAAWQEIPRTALITVAHTRQARTTQDLVLTLTDAAAGAAPTARRVEYRTGERAPIVLSYAQLVERVYNETWHAREQGFVPPQEEVQALLRICVATVRYAHCSLEDVLLQSRLFLATRLVTHECNRLGVMPPSAIENAARAAKRERPDEEEEAGEGGEEVEYHGGEVFAVTPGTYEGGHLELLDFDTYYLSIMTQFGLFNRFLPAEEDAPLAARFAAPFLALIQAKRAMRDATAKAGLKLEINTVYGVVGRKGSPIYNKALAAETTRLGRENIQRADAIVQELGGRRLFGHTDSILVQAPLADVCQAICDRVNKGRDIVCLKRSERFCFLWIQNRTRFIGIRPQAIAEGEEDWTAAMDGALVRSKQAAEAMLCPDKGEPEPSAPTPAIIAAGLVKHYESFAKFPGLMASTMPPAYKVALLTFTFTLLALYYKRLLLERNSGGGAAGLDKAERIIDLGNFAGEVGASVGDLLFQGARLQKLAWVHFSASEGKALMQVGPKQVFTFDELVLHGTAAACDCFWWKRRLHERLRQQVTDTLACQKDVPRAVIEDTYRYIDRMLPLGTPEEQGVALDNAINLDVIWAEIVTREDQAHNLPNMRTLALYALGDGVQSLPPLPTEAHALEAVRLYAKHTRDFGLEHPLWRDMALDAFAQNVLYGYNPAMYLALFREGLGAVQIRKALDKLPPATRATLQAICRQANQELCALLADAPM